MSAEMFLQWGRPVRERSRPILWPVDVHAVLVPSKRQRMNVFQEAILGMLSTGVQDLDEMALSLGLERELIAFIIAQELQPRDWLDARQRVTPRGLDALHGKSDAESSMMVVYAFQDAVTGAWLPRFSKDLPEIRATGRSSSGRPEFLESRGTGEVRRPYLLRRRMQSKPIDLPLLQSAWYTYLREARFTQTEGDESWSQLAEHSVEIQDDGPMQAWVCCEVYAPKEDLHPWLVSDPWRLSKALGPMREALLQELSKEKKLAEKMLRLVMPDEADFEGMTPSDRLAQLDLLAKGRIALEAPGLTKPEHDMMREYLLRVMRLRESVALSARPYQEELAALANQCGSLQEATIQWMLGKWPVDTRDWPERWGRRDLQGLLASLQLATPLRPNSIDALSGQDARQVRLAGKNRDRPFKALLVAALLSTHSYPDHPLKSTSDSGLDWELSAVRNDGSHATDRLLQKDKVLNLADSALSWFKQFETYL